LDQAQLLSLSFLKKGTEHLCKWVPVLIFYFGGTTDWGKLISKEE
jgi:hypothetical protein